MLRGDISNKQAPIIAFNIDNLLFKEQGDSSLLRRVKSMMMSDKSKFVNQDVDMTFVHKINNIWIKHPYSIYFITFTPYLDDLFTIMDKYAISYTSIIQIFEWEDLRRACGLQYMYYFDSDKELLSYISTKNALHIDELPNIIK